MQYKNKNLFIALESIISDIYKMALPPINHKVCCKSNNKNSMRLWMAVSISRMFFLNTVSAIWDRLRKFAVPIILRDKTTR